MFGNFGQCYPVWKKIFRARDTEKYLVGGGIPINIDSGGTVTGGGGVRGPGSSSEYILKLEAQKHNLPASEKQWTNDIGCVFLFPCSSEPMGHLLPRPLPLLRPGPAHLVYPTPMHDNRPCYDEGTFAPS